MRLRFSHGFSHRRIIALAVLAGAVSSRDLVAQRVLGPGEDATVLPRGTVRLSADATWSSYNELYGPGGTLQPLGAPLSLDSLGARQLALLRPIQTTLRSLAQLPNADISLGQVRTNFRARIARSAVTLDVGLLPRVQFTARLPYEHTISEVVLEANPREGATSVANVGPNPALLSGNVAIARNRAVVDSLVRAARDIATRLGGCTANPGDAVCGDRARAQSLVDQARTLASGLATTYGTGTDTSTGALLVPLEGSALQNAIAARVTALNAAFRTFIPSLSDWVSPFAAQVPLTSAQTQTLLTAGLGVAPIALVERSHIGDLEVGLKLLLIDTFGGTTRERQTHSGGAFRLTVGGLARLGTAQADRPDDLVDIGTGDGQNDVEVSGLLDVALSRRFWTSAVARYGLQMKDDQFVRIPDLTGNPFAERFRQQRVGRDLGDYAELQVTPRFVYNDYLALSGQWTYRRKAEDTYTGTFTVDDGDGELVALDAGVLGVDTDQTEQRVGGGLSFSTMRAFDRGRTGVPIEIQLLHTQSISGSGYAPKRFSSQVQIRFYTRLFGAPLRAR